MTHSLRIARTFVFARRLIATISTRRGIVAAFALSVYGTYLLLFLAAGAGPLRETATSIATLIIALLGIAASAVAARRHGIDAHSRRAWLYFMLSVIAISAASAILIVFDLTVGARPVLSIADLLYLIFYVLFLMGIMTLTSRTRTRTELLKLGLDVGTVLIAGGAAIWHLVFVPAFDSVNQLDAAHWLAFLWPVLDLSLLFGAAVALIDSSPENGRWTIRLIAFSGIAMFVGDIVRAASLAHGGTFAGIEEANLAWLLSGALWITAAQTQQGELRQPAATQEYEVVAATKHPSVLPYLAIVVVYLLLGAIAWSNETRSLPGILLSGLIITSLVVARQFTALHENARLMAERAVLQRELTRQAFQDPLTELASRTRFRARVERALRHAAKDPDQVAILFIDLDDFKDVNDTLGHAIGDMLLREVASRLLHATRGSDFVARLGGDEFAILADRAESDEYLAIIAQRALAALALPFILDGNEVFSGASIGIARSSAGMRIDELLRNADAAMYEAKQKGKGHFVFFQDEMQRAVSNRDSLERDLRRAIGGKEISLVYQPIVDFRRGVVVGVESLVRWQHETRGLMTPAQFVGLAEGAGMMLPLGRLILSEACKQGARWNQQCEDDEAFTVAVNLSVRQLQSGRLVQDVREALDAARLSPACLMLEVTENVIACDTALALRQLGSLRDLGVKLAVQNFGTGFSSIGLLQTLPMDVIKLDRSFVRDAGVSESGAAIARSIVSLGKALSMDTYAEGIENAAELRVVEGLGCAAGQGFYLSHPVQAVEIDRMISAPVGTAQ